MLKLPEDPAALTPQHRLSLVATILARGVARFHQRADPPTAEKLGDSLQPGLEVVSKPRLSVSHEPANPVGG